MAAKKVQVGWPILSIDVPGPALKVHSEIPVENLAKVRARKLRIMRQNIKNEKLARWPKHGIDAVDPALTLYFKEESNASSDLLKKPTK